MNQFPDEKDRDEFAGTVTSTPPGSASPDHDPTAPRQPTTYSELAKHAVPFGVAPDLAFPPLPPAPMWSRKLRHE
jgi:hypothetical protein